MKVLAIHFASGIMRAFRFFLKASINNDIYKCSGVTSGETLSPPPASNLFIYNHTIFTEQSNGNK
jgi:hypothetical protein